MPAIQLSKRYTYADYLRWDDDQRWELINGVPYNMSPVPAPRHQHLAGWLFGELRSALKGKSCIPFIAPSDVVLSDHDVVQPDVFVVCDLTKITDKNIQGAPDLVIEILSPATSRRDRWDKKRLYEKHGVQEYVVADLDGKYYEHYQLQKNGEFQAAAVRNFDEPLELKTIDNLSLVLSLAFDIPPFNETAQ